MEVQIDPNRSILFAGFLRVYHITFRAGHDGTFWIFAGHFGIPWDICGHCGTSRDIWGHHQPGGQKWTPSVFVVNYFGMRPEVPPSGQHSPRHLSNRPAKTTDNMIVTGRFHPMVFSLSFWRAVIFFSSLPLCHFHLLLRRQNCYSFGCNLTWSMDDSVPMIMRISRKDEDNIFVWIRQFILIWR